MGYDTDFSGYFKIDRPVDEDTYNLLYGLATTRRMARKADASLYGVEGEFYVDGSDYGHKTGEPPIIDINRPPCTQPGLWCQWLISDDRLTLEWDGGEKFYNYVEWLEYLVDRVIAPEGYELNGVVRWRGEDFEDVGTLIVRNNKVTVLSYLLPDDSEDLGVSTEEGESEYSVDVEVNMLATFHVSAKSEDEAEDKALKLAEWYNWSVGKDQWGEFEIHEVKKEECNKNE
jgi:hypothetical protein